MVHRVLIATVLIVLAAGLASPVYAYTTLGNLNSTPPFFRSNDHELNPTNSFDTAHVPGPLGYVWPGAGLNFYVGESEAHPGYQSPFENFEEPLQVSGSSYSPEGAILTSTPYDDNVGDLIFAINFSQPRAFVTPSNTAPTFSYSSVTIYIPAPMVDKHGRLIQDGFEPVGSIRWDLGDRSNIITTLTADYGRISVAKADMNDPFAPGWWVIRITPSGSGIVFTPEREWREWYYVRVNQLRAPDIAGRYFFKIFLGDHYPVKRQSYPLINSTMPAENWPVLLVKGELDPAIIYGTMRYGEKSGATLFGRPIKASGIVRAVGIASDPLTGDLANRAVEARGYFNASAEGHFEVEGVAPGIYDLYASASGFPEQKVAENLKLLRGQSLSIDLCLNPGPEVCGEVFSKGCIGLTPWKRALPISVVIYDSDNYIEDNVVSYSPLNLTHPPYTSYVSGDTIFDSGGLAAPNSPKLVAFPWEGPTSYYPYSAAPPFKDPFGVYNGVGPAQVWWVSPTGIFDPLTGLGSGRSSFRFQFGAQQHYGAPRLLSGMVPQVFATWTDGLGPGTYFVRAYVTGYIQTDVSGSKFQDYYFTITEGQTINVALQMDLWLTGSMNLTVHFHDTLGSMTTQVIGGPDPGRFLMVEAVDSEGSLAAFNFTYVSALSESATVTLNGLGMAGSIPPPDPRAGIKYSLFRYRGVRDYGVYPGTYFIRLYMRGYVQGLAGAEELTSLDQPTGLSTSLCQSVTSTSVHMFKCGGMNVTVYSADWQSPPSPKKWRWNETTASVLVYDVGSHSFVDIINFWNSALGMWSLPKTNSEYETLPWPGWRDTFGASSSVLVTNGSTILESLGPDLPSPPSLYPEQDIASNIFFQSSLHSGFLYGSLLYRTEGFRSTVAIYPGYYSVTGWTYGYVQEGVVDLGDLGNCVVSVGMGQIADAPIRLIQGVEFNPTILFRKEGLLSGLPSNMSVRIRIYDDRDTLVAAASTSLDIGAVQPSSDVGFYADGMKVMNAGGSTSPIPAGTQQVEYKGLAGLLGYVDPTIGIEAAWRPVPFSVDRGVWGDSANSISGIYSGGWQVLVDMVPWYRPSEFYPPPPGMLQGEIHQTNLTALLPYNHPGPFELRTPIRIPSASLYGCASVTLSLDLKSLLTGTVTAYNMHGDLRSVSWATMSLNGTDSLTTYSWDGFYEAYIPTGVYTATVEGPGLASQSLTVTVPDGGTNTLDFYLRPSGTPIPEYPAYSMLIAMTMAVCITCLSIMSNRRKKIQNRISDSE